MPVYKRMRYTDGRAVLDARGKPLPWLDRQGRPRCDARVGNRYKSFSRERDAAQWVHALEKRRDEGDKLAPDRRTVAEYMVSWLAMKRTGAVHDRKGKQRAPRPRTISDYQRAVTRWIEKPPAGLPPLGQCRLDRLDDRQLDAFYHAMIERAHTTARTVKALHNLLGQAFAEAVRKRTLWHNPCDLASVPQVDLPTEGATDEPEDDEAAHAMDEAQASRFLAAARQLEGEGCFSAFWHLLIETGLRLGEAQALQWTDVDLDVANVYVRHNLVRITGQKGYRVERPKTKNAIRAVPLPTLTLWELKAWRARQKWQRQVAQDKWVEKGFVFTSRYGAPLNGVRPSFERVCRAAELGTLGPEPKRTHRTGPLPARTFTPGFRPYDCRHTFATLQIKQGVPVHVVSRLLGHATAAFTLTVYAHALPEQMQQAAEVMDRIFGTGA